MKVVEELQKIGEGPFKHDHNRQQRIEIHQILIQDKILSRSLNPEHYVIVICEPSRSFLKARQQFNPQCLTPKLYSMIIVSKKQKVAKLLLQIRSSYKVSKSQTLHLYCNGSIISSGKAPLNQTDTSMSDLYDKQKDKYDDFLYVRIGNSEAFG